MNAARRGALHSPKEERRERTAAPSVGATGSERGRAEGHRAPEEDIVSKQTNIMLGRNLNSG